MNEQSRKESFESMADVFRDMKALMIKIKAKWELGHTAWLFKLKPSLPSLLNRGLNPPSGVHVHKHTSKDTHDNAIGQS